MNFKYELADGSPRYGSRTEDHTSAPSQPAATGNVEEAAEAAAQLGLDHLAAAIHRRLTGAWADREDHVVAGLRDTHPEELAAARSLVKLHLGSQRQWRMKAQAVRDKHLAATMRRRRAAGRAREIMFLRFGLMLALIVPPIYVLANGGNDILKLVLTGIACVATAFIGGHFITARSRIPVMPTIHGAWLNELRDDVINATLVAILQNKGSQLETRAAEAGQRGWKSIQSAAKAVGLLQG